jgi:predicted anti-sigma-YlaC factor YlaD
MRRRTLRHVVATPIGARPDCTLVVESLSAHLDSEEAPLDARLVETHLLRCAACRDVAAHFEALARETTVRPPVVVPDLTSSVLAALEPPSRDELPTRMRRTLGHRWAPVLRWAAPIVALGALVPSTALGAVGHFHVAPMAHVAPCVHTLMERAGSQN